MCSTANRNVVGATIALNGKAILLNTLNGHHINIVSSLQFTHCIHYGQIVHTLYVSAVSHVKHL